MNSKPFKYNEQWLLCNPSYNEVIETDWFEQSYWLNQGRLLGSNSGRGSAWVIKTEWGKWVLRHYFRGGLYAKVSKDLYLWTGLNQCRAFREFQLLDKIQSWGLPAPKPIAARVIKKGLYYSNDLIMEQIPHKSTWAQSLLESKQNIRQWEQIGHTIAQFHQHGIDHSDLNAHNILLSDDQINLIDFDNSTIKAPHIKWQKKNINRLKRSIEKVSQKTCKDDWSKLWQALVNTWQEELS